MFFEIQRFLFGFLIVLAVFTIAGCNNRPAAESWKYTSYHAELTAKPVDYIYAPKVEADGSLNANETRKLKMFLQETGFKRGDQVFVQSKSSYRGEGASQWISYWLEGQKIDSILQMGSLDLRPESETPDVQLTIRRYKLELANCAQNMAENISNVSSVTKKVQGCANEANLAHMLSNPSHLALGSVSEPRDAISAVRGIEDYWKGETKPLNIDQFDALSNGSGAE